MQPIGLPSASKSGAGKVDRGDRAIRQPEIGVGVVIRRTHRGDVVEAARDPPVVIAEYLFGRPIEHCVPGHAKNTFRRFIDLDDIQGLIERNDAIGQRLQNAFIVVLQREDI